MSVERRDFLKAVGSATGVGLMGTATAQTEGRTVRMVTEGANYYFDPIGLHVQPGETVTFVNEMGSHSATSYVDGLGGAQVTRVPDGADGWNSGILTAEGATFEHTFDVEGSYDYFCIPHKALGMVGRIVVGKPAGPAEGSMPTDGDVPMSDTIVEVGSVSYEAFTSGTVGGTPSDSGDGGIGGGTTQSLVGAALLGGLAALAFVVYRVANSEGERFRVGSAEWKREYRGR